MEIGAVAPAIPLPAAPGGMRGGEGDRAAPGALQAAAVLDLLATSVLDAVLLAEGTGSETLSLRLLPPEASGAALIARAAQGGKGELRLETALGTLVPKRAIAALPGTVLRFEIVSRRPSIAGPDGRESSALQRPADAPADDLRRWRSPAAGLDPRALGRLLASAGAALSALLPRLAETAWRRLRGAAETAVAFRAEPVPARTLSAQDGSGALWHMVPLRWPETTAAEAWLLRRERPASAAELPDAPERLVIEVAFARLGPVQLELSYRPGSLDLVLRSLMPLNDAIRAGAERRFRAAATSAGLTGRLGFALARPFPVSALRAAQPVRIRI